MKTGFRLPSEAFWYGTLFESSSELRLARLDGQNRTRNRESIEMAWTEVARLSKYLLIECVADEYCFERATFIVNSCSTRFLNARPSS